MPIISPAHRTPSLKKEETKKSWFVVDAEGKTLGRLCSAVATRLRGKHKATFTPNQDCGDNIIENTSYWKKERPKNVLPSLPLPWWDDCNSIQGFNQRKP